MTQNFSDIITTLENYGANYNPANASISIAGLKAKLTSLTAANLAVTNAYGLLKEKQDDRLMIYKQLTDITQRTKDSVKSQYGLKSTGNNFVKRP